MRREIRYGLAALRRRRMLALACWSVPEALPAAVTGLAIAHAVDDGFLAGSPGTGLAWLGVIVAAAVVGAIGSRQVYRRLGDLVEPVRDDLVRRVVGGALRRGTAGAREDGAIARLTRQVEIVRDSFAGLIVLVTRCTVTVVGVVGGLLSIDPLVAALTLPPFVLGFAAFVGTLGFGAARMRACVLAEEQVAAATTTVLTATRDAVATGAERHAAALAAGPIRAQAAAERSRAKLAMVQSSCFAIGGWLPLVVLLVTGPWLVARGATAGVIMGGLTYVLFGLQPALQTLHSGLGGAGLRFVVTLGRILDATASRSPAPGPRTEWPVGHAVVVAGLTFAYGPHAEPVLRDLDLSVPAGDHLAIVGPSGIGKSTLARLLCGLANPGAGTVSIGGCPAGELPAQQLAELRVLIPQEAYVFAGSVRENVSYLRPEADEEQVALAVAAIGAGDLVARLGGLAADVSPTELSAGERQLLALARAYLSPAPVVVLDEATCHLDPAAERVAEEAFAARCGTLIVIAHRISSALRARRVLVLDGAAATVGDHHDLVARSPLYRELLGHWGAETTDGTTDRTTDGLPEAVRN